MKESYNYKALIEELRMLLINGSLTRNSLIQIRRSERSIYEGYFPIVDWAFSDEIMQKLLRMKASDDQKTITRKMKIAADYEEDKIYFQSITISECLRELEKWDLI